MVLSMSIRLKKLLYVIVLLFFIAHQHAMHAEHDIMAHPSVYYAGIASK